MKKEEKERRDKTIDLEETFWSTESGSDEYGFEYDFFITAKNKDIKKPLARSQPVKQKKKEDTTDQSKTFFLPDFFVHED